MPDYTEEELVKTPYEDVIDAVEDLEDIMISIDSYTTGKTKENVTPERKLKVLRSELDYVVSRLNLYLES